ncbi:hypothetical protein JCM10207_003161 [Rhodosporidiobolus poonsookiae]
MTAQDVSRYRLEQNKAHNGSQVVNIKDSTSGKTIWTKTRELEDDEIVSTVFDSLHHPRWRMSRPTQGWYLILQRSTLRGANEPYIELKAAKKQAGAASDKDGLELVFTVATLPAQPSAASAVKAEDKETKVERRKSLVTVDIFFPPTFAGTPSLSPALVDASGLKPSFWVALCCAYAHAIEEREGWAAANEED